MAKALPDRQPIKLGLKMDNAHLGLKLTNGKVEVERARLGIQEMARMKALDPQQRAGRKYLDPKCRGLQNPLTM